MTSPDPASNEHTSGVPRLERMIGNRAAAALRRTLIKGLCHASRVPILARPGRFGMQRVFDSVAPVWDRIRSDPTYSRGLTAALDHLHGEPRAALDVACGTGLVSAVLRERYPRCAVTGIDISPAMIDRARRNVPSATFVPGVAESLPFDDGQFDLVVGLDAVFDVQELSRVCAREGTCVIVYSRGGTTPVSRNLSRIRPQMEALGFS